MVSSKSTVVKVPAGFQKLSAVPKIRSCCFFYIVSQRI